MAFFPRADLAEALRTNHDKILFLFQGPEHYRTVSMYVDRNHPRSSSRVMQLFTTLIFPHLSPSDGAAPPSQSYFFCLQTLPFDQLDFSSSFFFFCNIVFIRAHFGSPPMSAIHVKAEALLLPLSPPLGSSCLCRSWDERDQAPLPFLFFFLTRKPPRVRHLPLPSMPWNTFSFFLFGLLLAAKSR